MPYTLKVHSNTGPLNVTWENKDQLIKFSGIQTRTWEIETFDSKFTSMQSRHWHQRWGTGIYDIPVDGTVIDIGSGIGVSDLLLSKYRPDLNFNLYDKDTISIGGPVTWNPNINVGFYYNNWDVTKDAIANSNIDPDKFLLGDPNSIWPEADLITSHWSWCHHYSVYTYLDNVFDSLKPGGKLMVTVRVHKQEDAIGIINDKFQLKPIIQIPYMIEDAPFNSSSDHPDIWAWDCVWIKKI